MTTPTLNITRFCLCLCTLLFAFDAAAWDEDTCGPEFGSDGGTHKEDGGWGCASLYPLQGTEGIDFDHSTAHWEMTYLAARCSGVPDRAARIVAAADEATDMSSPYCGSKAANAKSAELYMNGYACGYGLDESYDAGNPGHVPAWEKRIQLAYTDRCFNFSQDGHGDYFHYPYWAANDAGTIPSLLRTQDWAYGRRKELYDQKMNCDMATTDGGCKYSMQSPPDLYKSNKKVCANSGTPQDWGMPAPYPLAGGSNAGFADGGATDDDWTRLGIYFHSAGDYYSHVTCQLYSGQPRSSLGWITLPPSGEGPTNHKNFVSTSSFAKNCSKAASPYNQAMCEAACGFEAHTCEFGRQACSQAGDAGTAVDTDLRNYSFAGCKEIWREVALRAGRTWDEAAKQKAGSFCSTFVGRFQASDRQESVRAALQPLPSTYPSVGTRKTECTCNRGFYGWVRGNNLSGDGGATSCCEEELVSGACPY